jgi:hypothetical protein
MTDQKNKQGMPDKDKKQSGNQDPMNKPQNDPGKTTMNDDTDEAVVRKGADIENPDMPGPDKKVELDDNPDETKKKIPNMNK